MTIWQIILYWMISEVLAWGLWWATTTIFLKVKVKDTKTVFLISEEMGAYPQTQSNTMEWIRFIVWPYGIAQRMMVTRRIYRKWTSD